MSSREWLVTDGLGGYAMGTEDGIRTRRYHSLLMVAAPDSERRFNLVNGVEAWLDTDKGPVALSSNRYAPDTVHPDGASRAALSSAEPPTWKFTLPGFDVEHSVHGVHGHAALLLRWKVSGVLPAKLRVRLQISARDWHSLHRENRAFRFDCEARGNEAWVFRPYDAVPPIVVFANARYAHAPLWFRQLQYDEERARGQDFIEDVGSPGEFTFDITRENREAVMVLTTLAEWGGVELTGDVRAGAKELTNAELQRQASFTSAIGRAADAYVVRRGRRRTIIAGYPWFTDWGRDTFISVRGLCIATGRLTDAEEILTSWCEHLSQGMMPNLFPSGAGAPEYNSVDASLWFIVAVHDLAKAVSGGGVPQIPLPFIAACEEILTHYARGTRHGIKMDSDGLLAAGERGLALTWMDAVVDGRPVTPRVGKPVEVQALWINALEFAGTWNTRWRSVATKARDSFAARFWNPKRNFLFDVVDVDHTPGAMDDRLRPNQIFACGGLPHRILDGDRAKAIVEAVERELWTPVGLRSLGRAEPGYVGRVDGPLKQRDLGYHQGTVWPWLAAALGRPIAGLSNEIADGDAPHLPRGCPFQAWTVGEAIRMQSFQALSSQ